MQPVSRWIMNISSNNFKLIAVCLPHCLVIQLKILPSDYIGIWAAVNGIPKGPNILYLREQNQGSIEELQFDFKIKGKPVPFPIHYLAFGPAIDSNGNVSFSFPIKNYEYMPLLPTSNVRLDCKALAKLSTSRSHNVTLRSWNKMTRNRLLFLTVTIF